MIKFEEYQKMALSLTDATEQPHFDIPSFRVKNKIFGTYWKKDDKAMLRLSPEDQSVFCAYDENIFYPVNGKWGLRGATFVNLKLVKKNMFKDALNCAYNFMSAKSSPTASKKKLSI